MKCIVTDKNIIKIIPSMEMVVNRNGITIYTDGELFYCLIKGWWYYFKDIDKMLKLIEKS